MNLRLVLRLLLPVFLPVGLLVFFVHRAMRVGSGLPDRPGVQEMTVAGHRYSVWRVDQATHRLRLRFADAAGPLETFARVNAAAQAEGEALLLAMNAGMFHQGGQPVGWCVSDGREVAPLNPSAGQGNFFLMPNGVFAVQNGKAGIVESSRAAAAFPSPALATQSGPLLVSGGVLHPAIREGSVNQTVRNGVGVDAGGTVWLVLSGEPVNFHEFATFFRDKLLCPDALYLDGAISAAWQPGGPVPDGKFGPFLTVSEPVPENRRE